MSRRTSDAEKVLNGTNRPFRLRGDPHSPPITATPKNPRWMKGRQRDHWRRLAPLLVGTIRESDLPALELFCADMARLDALREVLETKGETYESMTAAGALIIRPRPEVPLEKALASRVREWFAAFGLTPASKGRVMPVPMPNYDPLEEFLGPKRHSRFEI
jgi:P27 family predicted phage terminase small subunit